GPSGVAPTDFSWTWTDAAYVGDASGAPGSDPLAADEYAASFAAPEIGFYDVAYRFGIDPSGEQWTYCDRDGSANGYASAQAGALEVAPAGATLDACRLVGPGSIDAVLGAPTPAVTASVTVAGVTDGAG